MSEDFYKEALEYHKFPTPGKLTITPTKEMSTQRDLSLAYSPGVAGPCEEIAADPLKAYDYTARGNLVAVISNGTAVLGLGNIGALASKPVMEGKAVLFKKFAGIDSIDLEITPTNVDEVVNVVAALEPSFGGINLEDFKAPECFEIERRLKEKMKIPVFHDDQHGTAIVVAAAVLNWAKLTKRKMDKIKIVTSGGGASAIACLNMLLEVGAKRENVMVTDREGVVYTGRNAGMDPYKEKYARKTTARNLEEAMATERPDVFLGLSAAGVLKVTMLKHMADKPLILAMANPTPEIMPEVAREARPDAIIATGRSDYPNQVNNVLCFPFIFRGALDAGATEINEPMKRACAMAIAELAQQEATDLVSDAYGNKSLVFGPDYIIPKPFDPRIMLTVAPAVAKAAMETGVATRPIENWAAYKEKLKGFTNTTANVMRPVFELATKAQKKVIYAEGEESTVLRAAQMVVDERIAHPVLVGRRDVVLHRIQKHNLRLAEGVDFTLVDPTNDERYHEYWNSYHRMVERDGMTPADAKATMRTNTTVIGAMLLEKGAGDALICGVVRKYHYHLQHVRKIIPLRDGIRTPAAMFMLILPNRDTLFITDTHVNYDPNAQELADITVMAAEQVKRFGIEPKVALLSHSNFGSHSTPSALKMAEVLEILRRTAPHLEVDGEMHADTALSQGIRDHLFPHATLKGEANLLIMPNVDSANIAYNLMKIAGEATPIGPMLLGMGKPVHIVTGATKPQGIVNVTAHAVTAAAELDKAKKSK